MVVCITVSKGKHTEEVLAHENAAECSKCIAVAGLAFAMSNCDVSVLKQGNLDWHGNPSWFLGLQDESDFQTKISQKRLDILISFFLIIKIWYFGLHLALDTCYYPNLPKNGSHLKEGSKNLCFAAQQNW